MPSIEVRLVLFALVFLIFLAIRFGWIRKLQERRATKAATEAEQQRRQERQTRLRRKRQRQEQERRRTVEILERAAPGLRQKSLAAAGLEIWYLEEGRPDAPVVLLLHGFAGAKEDWAEVASRLLAAGYRVVAPDLPGFGQNRIDPNLSYEVTAQVKRIRAFARELGLERPHLVGCSLGAAIGAAYAYAASTDTSSLTLIEPLGVRVPYPSELDEMLAQGRNPLVVATPQAYDNVLGFLYSTVPDLPPGLKQYRAEKAADHRGFYLKMWKEVREGERAHLLDLLLPVLKIRTLVLLGGDSKVIHGATAEAIRAMMHDRARIAVIPGCGHFPMVERPAETAEHLLEFLPPVAPEPGATG
jgi:pimeloyl-ACP methyl ester carboxylesterase